MESARRISRFPSARTVSCFAFLLLWLCFVIGLAYGKECTNVPTERASHTLRSREIVHEEVESPGLGILAMPKSALISAFRKFLTWNGGDDEVRDDVLVELDDWGQAWRTMAKPMLDKTTHNQRGSSDQNDVPSLQLQVAEEIDGKYVESSEEVVSAVAGLLKDVSLHKVI